MCPPNTDVTRSAIYRCHSSAARVGRRAGAKPRVGRIGHPASPSQGDLLSTRRWNPEPCIVGGILNPESRAAPEGAAEEVRGLLYTRLRRRSIMPNPNRVLPRRARLAGSGTAGTEGTSCVTVM